MKKKLFALAVVSLVVCLIGFVAIACASGGDNDGKSNQGHLYLYQKCYVDKDGAVKPDGPFCSYDSGSLPPYVPVPPYDDLGLDPLNFKDFKDLAWGKLHYKLSGPIFKFEFEGHKLTPGKSYTLIYFPKFDTPGIGLIYFGSDIADRGGNVHIKGSLDTGDLPLPYDYDYYTDPPGARIWLVLSSDICIRLSGNSPRMIGWNPIYYLFPKELITFTDTDFDPDPTKDCAYLY